MSQLYVERHFELNRPRDQVWEYMTDLRRAMTLDQFHMMVDCTAAEATNPKAGMVVPILHRIFGHDQIRQARITNYRDYEIDWGESTLNGEYDPFPHSEGWKIEEVDSKTSAVTLWMKAQFRTPLGLRVGPYLWDAFIAPNLDQDVADLAHAVGAGLSRPVDPVPDNAGDLLSLAFVQTIDGVPAQEFFDRLPQLYPDKTADPGSND